MVTLIKRLVFSKSYTTTGNIAASGVSSEAFISQADQDKHCIYGGFTDIMVLNPDSVDLGIRFNANPDDEMPVGANNGSNFLENQNFAFFTIANKDAATVHTAGSIYIRVQKFIWIDITTGTQYNQKGENIGRVY